MLPHINVLTPQTIPSSDYRRNSPFLYRAAGHDSTEERNESWIHQTVMRFVTIALALVLTEDENTMSR